MLFFKRKSSDASQSMMNENSSTIEVNTSKCPRLESEDHPNIYFNINNLERDPRLCPRIWEYPINQRYEVIQAYLEMGSYQICFSEYPFSVDKNPRRFQSSYCQDLLNQPLHIDKIINAQKILHILANKVRHKIREDIGDSKFISLLMRHVMSQGYDGASKMQDEWNGFQALFLNDCPYAYYVHYLAHRFQLALVAASREVIPIHNLFSELNCIVNIINASSKCHDQLQAAQAIEIANMLAIDELETSKGLKQIGTMKQAGETCCNSHFSSVCSLIKMFDTTCSVLENATESGSNYSIHGDAATSYKKITSFDFVFILHLLKEIMGITYILCQQLHKKSQDIVNHNIDVLDMDSPYVVKHGHHQHVNFNMEHHYHVEIFNAAIDSQLLELNSRFNEQTIYLLILSSALDPKNAYKSFVKIERR
ncbi:hypothetical protein ES332_D10G213200v1 [Gossypium tomentosum]|uniref:DUF4371 domain-containing protein n=1 Tax=Gossypium tomentosum TaxID=34277 RepID=A0A5D2J941_GOSTO|nr:hypothetical protein ES332_D10G213200v1 [Gossypium tomentosum]